MAGPMLKFIYLEVFKSNFVLEAAALEEIFDPQNHQNRGLRKNSGNRNVKLLYKTGGVVCQFSEKLLQE